ncbi:DUF1707 and DUF4190 domain-containing protein [Yinghuangia seranimata]|uniref:DUF1707 and DUF4190 domain-containing protein n=1 Tax=Yinghuangia seranimata TaxID=408067 RepID=UPI00248BE9E3|nr:DUF1707 and DUF4190 domain-containing protein [Yinghuangia seranimata]MDI2126898.1 DUF1707 and DUF4190 domain-containing protein [Yinghuangia seranimata]
MSDGWGGTVPDDMRCASADRDRCADVLKAGWAEGRLTDAEYHERLELALKARTYGDLRALVRDLPTGPTPTAPAPQPPPQAQPPAPYVNPYAGPYGPRAYNPYAAPPVWGYPHLVPARPPAKTNPLAVVSLLTAILTIGPGWIYTQTVLYPHGNPFPIVFGLIAVLTGALALRQNRQRPYPENGGSAQAAAGVVIGSLESFFGLIHLLGG